MILGYREYAKQFSCRSEHMPVLLREVNQLFVTDQPLTYIDCTFGAGGHSRSLLQNNPNIRLIAIDRDPRTQEFAEPLISQYQDRFKFYHTKFSEVDHVAQAEQLKVGADGILVDLGLSSMQLADTDKGFSFQGDSPLLMQMGYNSISAIDFLNEASERKLAEVILNLGEERKAKTIASAIVAFRNKQKIVTTLQLSSIINRVYSGLSSSINYSTKTFQAIRMYVNNELTELSDVINQGLSLLAVNGKMAIISFHSLEDRIVKMCFNEAVGKFIPHLANNKANQDNDQFTIFKPTLSNIKHKKFEVITKKVIKPQRDEELANKRSRSAKLRIIKRVE